LQPFRMLVEFSHGPGCARDRVKILIYPIFLGIPRIRHFKKWPKSRLCAV
jgi:hypothetical protein